MSRNKVSVVDYGVNNVASICKALRFCNIEYKVTSDPDDIEKCSHIILPGVGSFDYGCDNLKKNGLMEAINLSAKKGVNILGICLGMQLLFDTSNESKKNTVGLGLLEGYYNSFDVNNEITIPHIGWNTVFVKKEDETNIVNIFDKTDQYFVHSFYIVPHEDVIVSAECLHGVSFPAVISKDNIFGTQFHPEKSSTGIQFIDNFCNKL